MGQQNNVNEWLSAFDVFLMPSLWEGLPVSVVEAQCSGLSCVIYDVIDRDVYLKGQVKFLSKKYGFMFIPQIGGMPREMPFGGVFTFCLHPSMMSDSDFERVENFLKEHHSEFVSFKDLDFNGTGSKSVFSRLLSFVYFANRRLKGIK